MTDRRKLEPQVVAPGGQDRAQQGRQHPGKSQTHQSPPRRGSVKQRFAGFGRDGTHLNIVSTSDLRSGKYKIRKISRSGTACPTNRKGFGGFDKLVPDVHSSKVSFPLW